MILFVKPASTFKTYLQTISNLNFWCSFFALLIIPFSETKVVQLSDPY